jgi:hypothetical protein
MQVARPPGGGGGGFWPPEKVACRIPTPLPLQNDGTLTRFRVSSLLHGIINTSIRIRTVDFMLSHHILSGTKKL